MKIQAPSRIYSFIPRIPHPGLYLFSIFLAAATLFLILAGGLVTSHEAGLAVPDWPLSYGQFFPPMVGNIFWEHGHRMIAGTVGILTLLLAAAVQIWESREATKRLAWAAFGAVVLQAVLGGLTVRYLLPAPISIFHACLAQTFFCLTIALAYLLSGQSALPKTLKVLSLERLLKTTTGLLFAQLVLGAAIRHTSWTPAYHVVFAFVVIFHVLLVARRITTLDVPSELLGRLGPWFGLITIVQIFLGMGAFIFTRMLEQGYGPGSGRVFFTAIHQTWGALILGLSVLMTLRVSQK